MRVEIRLSPDEKEPHAVIHASRITEEIEQAARTLEKSKAEIITARQGERIVVLHADDIYMVRTEAQETVVYTEKKKYTTGKRLYEMEEALGEDFMRISKSTIVCLRQVESVEPAFSGAMYLILQNGLRDSISRRYLSAFKQYLGI